MTRCTFLPNHAPHIAAIDLFVVPTITFIQLYVLLIVPLARRELVWVNVTSHPTAEWIARQITEALHQDLGLQLLSRLEVVAQHANEQEPQRARLAGFVTSRPETSGN